MARAGPPRHRRGGEQREVRVTCNEQDVLETLVEIREPRCVTQGKDGSLNQCWLHLLYNTVQSVELLQKQMTQKTFALAARGATVLASCPASSAVIAAE